MQTTPPLTYNTQTLTHLLNALYISHANLSKTSTLLRTQTPDRLAQTVTRLARTLSAKVDSTWSPTRCARQVVAGLTPTLPRIPPPTPASNIKDRTIVRIVPADNTSSNTVISRGGHPYLEIVLKASKPVWELTSHLFAKWGLPVLIRINGDAVSPRARLAVFLQPPHTDRHILHATFTVAEPHIPASVFRAARLCALLPDAPPAPPPLPPLPARVSHTPMKNRTYAAPPGLHAHLPSSRARAPAKSVTSTPSANHSPTASGRAGASGDATDSRALPLPDLPDFPNTVRSFAWCERLARSPRAPTSGLSAGAVSTTVDGADNVSASASVGKRLACALSSSPLPSPRVTKRRRLTTFVAVESTDAVDSTAFCGGGLRKDDCLEEDEDEDEDEDEGGDEEIGMSIPEAFLKVSDSVDVPVDMALPDSILSLGASSRVFRRDRTVGDESPSEGLASEAEEISVVDRDSGSAERGNCVRDKDKDKDKEIEQRESACGETGGVSPLVDITVDLQSFADKADLEKLLDEDELVAGLSTPPRSLFEKSPDASRDRVLQLLALPGLSQQSASASGYAVRDVVRNAVRDDKEDLDFSSFLDI